MKLLESSSILDFPNENGIVVFVLGLLFILSVYHFTLYFQHKDKTYLYYSLFTFLIFVNHLNDPENGFVYVLVEPIRFILDYINIYLIWLYNLIYFVFAFTFVDVKKYSLTWHKIIFNSVYVLMGFIVLVEIIYLFTHNDNVIFTSDTIFIIAISILAILGYIPLLKMYNPLKYYIIIGSLILFISSIAATIMWKFNLTPDTEIRYSIFYIGIVLENICFSLGLGHKQKQILEERNISQENLISQLQENNKLRDAIQEKLEEDIVNLSEQAKSEKLLKLKEKYDREMAELKITSLRSQMNPHFIFNSLNSIKLYIINNDKQNAVYYLNKFSKLIRKILASTQTKEISLSDEIETMKLYIGIENIRFENTIDFNLDIDETLNLETIKIPSLVLQPFIENAIWHGLAPKKEDKNLNLSVFKEDNNLVIEVIDNGIGRIKAQEIKSKKMHNRKSVGIALTEERLQNFAKDNNVEYDLIIEDAFINGKPNGTKVILKINLLV
ncbi:hypothetical protein EGM88_09710 [Aureibaculum marinum]|uniref:Signal transduction histidine kinase internal region domain-containing protein n=1 Tax=Aureibaculum marinum TaxID=2487930 RepID=A0A3N4NYG8_9FLAO|nr:7TM diverse intracellular signaling domain-containing protein [Aureibaculum marinum]RPD96629.1 hypothetical protein EGM88_09710 [Aureibaculum marinum]